MAAPLGFSVSVDGEHVSCDPVAPDVQRRNDVALQRTDIQVKFDGLDIQPMLNVLPADQRSTCRPGDVVPFLLTTNYPAFIARAELRIFEAGQNIADTPLAIIEAPLNGVSNWTMPTGNAGEFVYVARVYDRQGRFDETVPLTLRRTARDLDDRESVAAGWGEDRTGRRTIPLVGGAVTVYGTRLPAGASVRALGETIPVDGQRAFVVQRILPAGDHAVDVVVAESGGTAMAFSRAINIPDNDWFYVAMADLTLGQRFGSGRLVAADPSEFDGIYAKGHLAFYLKGKIKGEHLLTAAADTGEGPLDQMFTGILSKDPQALLRRIDPNQYYPVYGDDSTSFDDAPTRGKLYVRHGRHDDRIPGGRLLHAVAPQCHGPTGLAPLPHPRDGSGGIDVSYAHLSDGAGRRQHLAAAELRYELDPYWELALGVDYLVQRDPSRGMEWNGERSDVGVRLTYRPHEDLSLYGFAQASLHTSAGFNRNDRVGGGLNWQLSEAIALGAELSYGTTALGGLATISYQDGPDKRTYFGYRLTPEQQVEFGSTGNTPLSGLVAGTEQRLSDAVSVHAENTFSIFTRKQTLLSSYGVTLTPDSQWTISGAVETGRVFDPDASDFDRQAIFLGTRYADKTVQAHIHGEVRFEDSLDDTRDRQSYLLATGLNWQTSNDWRLQASLDGVISRSGQAVILDGDYVEANVGQAYRPVDNERLEALFRYTYLHDLPGHRQVNAAGASMGPAQRSHVLSVDANYDINAFVTVGAKYGFRIGSVPTTRLEQDFQTSSAHLGILRADIDIPEDWAVLLEGRALYLPEAGNLDLGALAAVYRDVGNDVELGVGYNFGQFSDNLKDLTYDDHVCS